MNTERLDTLCRRSFIVFLVLMCGFLLKIGVLPFANPDTTQYIHESAFRSPGYPLFLHLDMIILGANNFYLTFLLQLALGITSAFYTGREFQKLLTLPKPFHYLFSIIFLIPYFFGDYKFANRLLSEGICYPLYLVGFINLLKGLSYKRIKPLGIFLVSLFLMLLIRPQMMFLIPIAGVAVVYVWAFFDIGTKNKLFVSCLALVSIVGANLVDRTYHYVKHGHFATEPAFGLSVIAPALYLSQPSDVKLIPQPADKKIFLASHNKAFATNANIAKFKRSRAENIYYHFAGSYNPIVWGSFYNAISEMGISNYYSIDQHAENIALPLLKAHWKKYLALWFFAVKEKFGGYYWLLFYMLLVVGALITHIKSRDRLTLILFFCLLASAANYCSVALVEIIIRRYSVYTESFQVVIMLSVAVISIFNSIYQSHRHSTRSMPD